MTLSITARAFITLVIILGLCVFGIAITAGETLHPVQLISFVVVACLAARLKVKLPGLTGSMCVNVPFILIAAAEMGLAETLLVGCLSNFVQCLPRDRRKFNLMQTAFNVSMMALAVGATRLVYESRALSTIVATPSLRLAIAAAGFFLANTIPVAIVIFLTEGKSIARTWLGMFQISFPYFLASAGVAGVVMTLAARVGWPVPLAILPLMAGVYYSYQRLCSMPPKLWTGLPLTKMGPESVTQSAEKQSLA